MATNYSDSRGNWRTVAEDDNIPLGNFLKPLPEDTYPARTVAFTGTAGSTGTWPAGADGVLVWSDQACYVAVGEGVTATTSSAIIPPLTPIPFRVPRGTGAPWRVSAIQVSAGGTVYCTPINAG